VRKIPKNNVTQKKKAAGIEKCLAPSCCNVSATIDDPKLHPLNHQDFGDRITTHKNKIRAKVRTAARIVLSVREEMNIPQHPTCHKINPRCPSNGLAELVDWLHSKRSLRTPVTVAPL